MTQISKWQICDSKKYIYKSQEVLVDINDGLQKIEKEEGTKSEKIPKQIISERWKNVLQKHK